MFIVTTIHCNLRVIVKYETKAMRKSTCSVCGKSAEGRVLKILRIENVSSDNPEVVLSFDLEKKLQRAFHHNVGKILCGECLS